MVFGGRETNDMMRLLGIVCLASVISFSAMPDIASAQISEPVQVDSSPKGLIGLGLIGAELGLVIPAAAGLDDTWALITFPAIGAVGGALAGHFLIDNNNHEKVGIAMLVTGIALVVPTVLLTAHFLAYDPSDEGAVANDDDADAEAMEEIESNGVDGDTQVEVESADAPTGDTGFGLVQVARGQLRLGVPNLEIVQAYTRDELMRYGGEQTNEYHLSLVSGSF